jgi:Raf kinase inhibitor-like YbhB/YbcL family protein
MTFTVKSPVFAEGSAIPTRYTCDGDNVSPALSWSGQPVGTKSFVLIMDDPDAPSGTFTHWVLFDVPAPQHEFAKGHRAGISG